MSISLIRNNVFSYFKNNKKAAVVFGMLFVFILFTIIPAFAGVEETFEDICKDMVAEIFSGGLSESVKEIVVANPATSYPDAWEIMEDVYNDAVLPVAFGLLTIHLVIAVIQQSIKLDQLTWQQFIKPFLTFIAAWFVMVKGMKILVILIGLSQEILETMTVASDSSMDALLNKANSIVDEEVTGIFTGIGFMVKVLVPWIAALILSLAIKIVCYTRVFELYLKTMIAPLGMSDVVTKGLDGNGLRFFKNYFATCLQGAIIVGVSIVYGAILGNVIGAVDVTGDTVSITSLTGTALVMGFAALSMMMKAGQITKEVLGA